MKSVIVIATIFCIPSLAESFRDKLIQRMNQSPMPIEQQVQHVLSRLYYGGHADRLALGQFLKKDAQGNVLVRDTREALADAINHSLHGVRNPRTDIEDRLNQLYPVTRLSYGQKFVAYANKPTDPEKNQLRQELRRAEAYRQILHSVASPRPFLWVLTDFWFNHFNVQGRKVPFDLEDFRRGLQRKMFTSFPEMLLYTAKHPAMLFYLDNARSQAPEPNENYAREIMELHTLGVGPEAFGPNNVVVYRQGDIRQAAKLFSGWSVSRPDADGRHFEFRPNGHVQGTKRIMGRNYDVGAKVGQQAVQEFIRYLALHPRTARSIARKLVYHFVSETAFGPDNDAVQNLIGHLQNRYLATNGNLVHLYETLLLSHVFWSPRAYLSKTKRPLEFVVSALRSTGAATGMTAEEIDGAFRTMNRMGQELVSYSAPTGYSDDSRFWSSTGNALEAMRYGQLIAEYKGDHRSKLESYERCEGPTVSLGCHFRTFFEIFRGDHQVRFLANGYRQNQIRLLLKNPDTLRTNGQERVLRSALASVIGSAEFQRK